METKDYVSSRVTSHAYISYCRVVCKMIVELAVLALTLALIYHFFFEFRGHNLPPGPRPWPVIGNMRLMGKDLHLTLTKLQEKYGKIYRLFAGHKMLVVVSGDMIKEALVRNPKQFAGRPTDMGVSEDAEPFKLPGLPVIPYGPKWKLFRKLNHSAIKVYSEGHLQEVICKEVDELCKRLASQNDKPVDIMMEFNISVTNVIMTQLTGERYEINDPEFRKIFNINNELTNLPMPSQTNRLLHFLFPKNEMQTKLYRLMRQRYDVLEERYLQHKERFDGETIKDFTDALLLTKQEAEKEDSANNKYLTDPNIITAGMSGLFTAGAETTSTTLSWGVAYLLHNPDIQERLHRDILALIGPDEFPTLSAKKSLPTLEAFTTETLRMANLVPLAIPHMTTEDVLLNGYNIPKCTRVLANTWSLHHDPEIWKDPFKFSVDRHLDESGKFTSPVGGTFLPFGAGPRVCVGEVLARSELFMFLCRLLQQFKFENPSGCELPSLKGESAIILHPKKYFVLVTKRN